MRLFIVGTCPICMGGDDLVILMDKVSRKPIFYCTSCSSAWVKMPALEKVRNINPLHDLAPGGVFTPEEADLIANNITWSDVTSSYKNLEDLI